LKNLIAVFIGVLLSVIILEVGLRILNPLDLRVRGNSITLPANKVYELKNINVPGLQTEVIHTKNSRGFRGPEPDQISPGAVQIIAVGGSTTESFYQSDGLDWPAITASHLLENGFNVWINNAGLDGHSTFGHLVLLRDYLIDLRPDVILLMAGLNDVSRLDMDETHIRRGIKFNSLRAFVTSLSHYSEIAATSLHLYRVFLASSQGLRHEFLDFKSLNEIEIVEENIRYALEYQEEDKFRERMESFVVMAKNAGITPILITQASVVGFGIDKETGIDLERVDLGGFSGRLFWEMVELYNDIVREIASEHNLYLIDLATELEKNTRFFYDAVHMTDEGAAETGRIIGEKLEVFLEKIEYE